MEKEIKVQRTWFEGLLEYAKRVQDSKLLKSDDVEIMKQTGEIHSLLGYIDSTKEILK